MKVAIAIAGVLFSAALAMAAPAPATPPTSFNPVITRQDFTGQGTYHRVGLVREQNRALAAQAQAAENPPTPSQHPNWWVRLWQSIFPPRSKTLSPS